MQPTFTSSRILLPASRGFIALTFCAALLLNFLPLHGVPGIPDWVALNLCFWAIRERRVVNVGWAFIFGLLMDVADGAVMGQHALGYVPMVFLAEMLSRRILWFPLVQQSFHVLPLLLLAQGLQFMARSIGGGEFPDLLYFLGPVLAAVLWAPVTFLLLLPQFQPVDRDENRPI